MLVSGARAGAPAPVSDGPATARKTPRVTLLQLGHEHPTGLRESVVSRAEAWYRTKRAALTDFLRASVWSRVFLAVYLLEALVMLVISASLIADVERGESQFDCFKPSENFCYDPRAPSPPGARCACGGWAGEAQRDRQQTHQLERVT